MSIFPQLEPGDIVAVASKSWMAKPIRAISKLWSKDDHTWSNHALLMKDSVNTYEAVWSITSYNFCERYAGDHVVVGRLKNMNEEQFQLGWEAIEYMEGKWYPFPRLLLFFVPFLPKLYMFSKISGFGFFATLVCSELTGLFCHKADPDNWNNYRGLTPDDIADRIINWRSINLIYQGTVPEVAE